ncbi:MAG: hypothetical protein ACTSWR_01880 [Candidatus Helarchaeota archaeon]
MEENVKSSKFKTKINLAIDLLDLAIASSIKFRVLIFDTWYICKKFCNNTEIWGKNWMSCAKFKRVINMPTDKTNPTD